MFSDIIVIKSQETKVNKEYDDANEINEDSSRASCSSHYTGSSSQGDSKSKMYLLFTS